MSDDLVQRLRKPNVMMWEAADRIEGLEKTIWLMHSEEHEHIKRIEALEAALRAIKDGTIPHPGRIARFALLGKDIE